MWLSGLHIPESYLTALVQATCRKNGWPLDKSTLYTQVTQWQTAEDVTERAHQGCFIHGLYLEGASWDITNSCLIKQNPKELIKELPVMKVIPIEGHKLKLQVIQTPHRLNIRIIWFCLSISKPKILSIRWKEYIPYACVHNVGSKKCDGRWTRVRSRFVHKRTFESLGSPGRLFDTQYRLDILDILLFYFNFIFLSFNLEFQKLVSNANNNEI